MHILTWPCPISVIPHPISDSIWLTHGSLLVGAGHLLSLYGQPKATKGSLEAPESLFEHVARHNGPLNDYHPQLILQCLLWGTLLTIFIIIQTNNDVFCVVEKVELVKSIIVNLAHNIARTRDIHEWDTVPLADFIKKEVVKAVRQQQSPVQK